MHLLSIDDLSDAQIKAILDEGERWFAYNRQPRRNDHRLDGLTIGLLDIAKARGDVFLDRLDERLRERGLAVKRYKKPTNTRPAPLPLQQQIATEVNLVIEGLSD